MIESQLPTPYYIVYEEKLRTNLELIADVSRRSGAEIIMAFKANALWRTFDIIKEYGFGFTASSLNEMWLGNKYLGVKAHTYCPVYTDSTIDEFLNGSSHITFNSLDQARRYKEQAIARGVSCGIRVNPMCSVIETDIYNPALPGSRFGVSAEQIGQGLPEGIEGLHFHALCESDSKDLVKVLEAFESQFGHLLPQVKWVNMGGGHLMTRKGYDIDLLIGTINSFKNRHPHIDVILEPGSAFTWRTGDLVASVLDIVENQGIATAIVDASFACHMPDCLEMPYRPAITGSLVSPTAESHHYRVGGNSCLSGDYIDGWDFDTPLEVGQRLRFEDMNHYTNVKTNMFNGIQHPMVVLCDKNEDCKILRQYTFDDYLQRMC